MPRLRNCHNIHDLRAAARSRLPRGVFEYLDRGTEDEVALGYNRGAYDRLKLLPRAFRDLRDMDLSGQFFGKKSALPLAISPTGVAGLCWYEGELALARAAASAGIPFTLATGSITALEKVAAQAGGTLWFQLYMWQEEDLSFQLIDRARDAGYEALVVTVDIGLGNNREYNQKNGFSIPFKPSVRSVLDVARHPEWMFNVWGRYLLSSGMPRHENYPPQYQHRVTAGAKVKKPKRHDNMTAEVISRIRAHWPHKLIIKGLMSPEDAAEAVRLGADAIIVSNHGGRNLDSTVAAIDMLPAIVSAVDGRAEVYIDSGIRRGSDIVKALARGADGAMIGRATLYGVATAGQAGAEHAIGLLSEEMRKTMGYLGCTHPGDLGPHVFGPTPGSA